MHWPMNFKHANGSPIGRSLVCRSGHGRQAALRTCVGGPKRRPRYALVLAAQNDARLALASVVLITTQFENTRYEVTLQRVSWLHAQSYINVQSIQPVKFTEFVHKAPGKFDASVISNVEAALK